MPTPISPVSRPSAPRSTRIARNSGRTPRAACSRPISASTPPSPSCAPCAACRRPRPFSFPRSPAGRARHNLGEDYATRAEAIVNRTIFPALDRQIALVTELRGRATDDAGVWRLPQGAEYYAAAVRDATTTTLSPEEVHQLGLAQVAEISSRIGALLDAQGMAGGDVGARLTALSADPAQLYPNTDEGRAALLADLNRQIEQVDALLPRAFATRIRAQVRVVRVPEFIQDGASNGYYNAAPFDNSRPAQYYINLKDTHDWPKYGLPSLTYHEAMPGHHLADQPRPGERRDADAAQVEPVRRLYRRLGALRRDPRRRARRL